MSTDQDRIINVDIITTLQLCAPGYGNICFHNSTTFRQRFQKYILLLEFHNPHGFQPNFISFTLPDKSLVNCKESMRWTHPLVISTSFLTTYRKLYFHQNLAMAIQLKFEKTNNF